MEHESDESIVLRTRIVKDDVYTEQEGPCYGLLIAAPPLTPRAPGSLPAATIITWTEPSSTQELALSFQERDGKAHVWASIQAHRQALLLQEAPEGASDASPPTGSASPPPTGDGTGVLGGRAGSLADSPGSEWGMSGLEVAEDMGGLSLPQPTCDVASLKHLQEVVEEAGASLLDRDTVASIASADDHLWLRSLGSVFVAAEGGGKVSICRAVHGVLRALVLTATRSLLETLTSDTFWPLLVAAFEYDPASAAATRGEAAGRPHHRRFLRAVKFRQAVPLGGRGEALEDRAHQTFRLQFLRDVLLPRALDDSFVSLASSIITANHLALVMTLSKDDTFLTELLAVLRDPTRRSKRRVNILARSRRRGREAAKRATSPPPARGAVGVSPGPAAPASPPDHRMSRRQAPAAPPSPAYPHVGGTSTPLLLAGAASDASATPATPRLTPVGTPVPFHNGGPAVPTDVLPAATPVRPTATRAEPHTTPSSSARHAAFAGVLGGMGQHSAHALSAPPPAAARLRDPPPSPAGSQTSTVRLDTATPDLLPLPPLSTVQGPSPPPSYDASDGMRFLREVVQCLKHVPMQAREEFYSALLRTSDSVFDIFEPVLADRTASVEAVQGALEVLLALVEARPTECRRYMVAQNRKPARRPPREACAGDAPMKGDPAAHARLGGGTGTDEALAVSDYIQLPGRSRAVALPGGTGVGDGFSGTAPSHAQESVWAVTLSASQAAQVARGEHGNLLPLVDDDLPPPGARRGEPGTSASAQGTGVGSSEAATTAAEVPPPPGCGFSTASLLYRLIWRILEDPDVGVQGMAADTLTALLSPEGVGPGGADDFLGMFYDHYMPLLALPLTHPALLPLPPGPQPADILAMVRRSFGGAGAPPIVPRAAAAKGRSKRPRPPTAAPGTPAITGGDGGEDSGSPGQASAGPPAPHDGEGDEDTPSKRPRTSDSAEKGAEAAATDGASAPAAVGESVNAAQSAEDEPGSEQRLARIQAAAAALGQETPCSKNSKLLLLSILSFCVEHHTHRIAYFLVGRNVVVQVTRCLHYPDKYMQLAAVRFIRACICKSNTYNRLIMTKSPLARMLWLLATNGPSTNLVNSAILETLHFIGTENSKELVHDLGTRYASVLRALPKDIKTPTMLLNKAQRLAQGLPLSNDASNTSGSLGEGGDSDDEEDDATTPRVRAWQAPGKGAQGGRGSPSSGSDADDDVSLEGGDLLADLEDDSGEAPGGGVMAAQRATSMPMLGTSSTSPPLHTATAQAGGSADADGDFLTHSQFLATRGRRSDDDDDDDDDGDGGKVGGFPFVGRRSGVQAAPAPAAGPSLTVGSIFGRPVGTSRANIITVGRAQWAAARAGSTLPSDLAAGLRSAAAVGAPTPPSASPAPQG